ncbi:DUF3124 domain-containing protein [Desulfovibrio inopinatus]|uniref:DUF3124 domain-containing protein n=1 Tax=Desulfovibrio inopinatus TaxID=102109 RepID=UPI0003FE463A|nr:DUF3124 domain-containing protein [Desulfovibrio inopinatus]
MHPSRKLIALLFCVVLLGFTGTAIANGKSTGQTLYVPCYSSVHHGIKTRTLELTVTLSLHNVDPSKSIRIDAVEYYNTEGKKVRSYIESPIEVGPLGTQEFIVDQQDTEGGSGANFIVKWKADSPVNAPLAEAVMIGTSSNQGISFLTRGVVITP